MKYGKSLLVPGAVAVALATVAGPTMAQTAGAGTGVDTQQQSMARIGAIDQAMLGLPVVRNDGALVGWLTGANMPNTPGVALIERPPVGDDRIEVYAINQDALRVQGGTLVIGGQLAAREADYGTEGAIID